MTSRTVLVVDDEPASVRALASALREEARVVAATTAVQGLAALACAPVALVIAAQRPPGMTGMVVLGRTAVQRPEVVRILLAGATSGAPLVDAVSADHVDYYLAEPWEPLVLRLVVRRALERYDAEADRRRLRSDLEQARRRARHEAERTSRLLAMASHELGTPVHILAHALAFLSATELPAPARAWVDTAARNTEWLARGLTQMATAAHWRGSLVRLQRAPTDLAALLHRVRAAFAPIAAARRLVLHHDIEAALPTASVDPPWLEHALRNLVANAVRFTPDGGEIRIAARGTPGAVELSVSDTGIGIAAHLLDVLFEPLSAATGDLRLHTSGHFEFGARGFGLGLAIVKAIVAGHDGSIAVHSEPGAGSRFTVTLPLRAADDG